MDPEVRSSEEIGMTEALQTTDEKLHQQESENQSDEEEVLIALTCRGTQTILTSRGLMSLGNLDAVSIGPVTNTTRSAPAAGARRELKSSATQATPRVSVCGTRLLATTSADCPRRSPVEILRRSNLQEEVSSAASAPVVRNETITLTTDYESRISEEVSQLLQEPILSTESASSSQPSRSPDSPPPTLFYDPSTPASPDPIFPCCQRPQPVAQVDSRAPPTYSALYPRSSSADGHSPVLIDNRDPHSSFIARDPPPSYAQAQGICVAYSLERLFSSPLATSGSDGRIWSPRSTAAVCPRCATLVFTIVEVHQATVTHVAAFTLFIMGCWPCCLLPYCIDSCKTSHHYCPFCRSYLGTYNPS